MEDIKSQETNETYKKAGTIVLCGTFIIGYIMGRVSSTQLTVDAYRRGVSDTLNSIVFTHR